MDSLRENFARVGIAAQVVGHPVLFDVMFSAEEITDYRAVFRADVQRQKQFNTMMRERGILKPDSKFYISTAHDQRDVDQTTAAIADVATAMAAA